MRCSVMMRLLDIPLAAALHESDGLAMWQGFVESFRSHLEAEAARAPMILAGIVVMIVIVLNVRVARRVIYGKKRPPRTRAHG